MDQQGPYRPCINISKSIFSKIYMEFKGHERANMDPIWTGYRVISIWCSYGPYYVPIQGSFLWYGPHIDTREFPIMKLFSSKQPRQSSPFPVALQLQGPPCIFARWVNMPWEYLSYSLNVKVLLTHPSIALHLHRQKLPYLISNAQYISQIFMHTCCCLKGNVFPFGCHKIVFLP